MSQYPYQNSCGLMDPPQKDPRVHHKFSDYTLKTSLVDKAGPFQHIVTISFTLAPTAQRQGGLVKAEIPLNLLGY